ncbi:NAD(P)/FAD-dependent oxidoreductase [Marivirga atlantica]|jgi:thioredoxin reductase (NADPH)|uniref:Ferredoxin--NADP reductase n=1 Tax=Marivirga atlantica TaxID=1548457 RepID=A0A937ACF9_9BACT|nr:NAD(P)/FAD-dependent oxidoreductase [Marivirga atlantica]MBL0766406.1 NAD(P)/FAD-dependent oxidoreductase [Marivirga atlantica]
MIQTDICIIGAGPVGLFSVFEAGLLKLRCHLVDALPQVGGQLSEIYPKKPIYDIPGFPEVKAQELVDNLMEQIKPFNPTFTLGERLDTVEKTAEGFHLTTSDGTNIDCKVVVIAGGLGCFEPRKPPLQDIANFEGKGVSYMVKDPELFRDKNVVLAGGGDSALDWTIELSKITKNLTLVHRNETFRGAPDSAEKVFELAKEGKINLLLKSNLAGLSGNGKLNAVKITGADKSELELDTDYLIPLFGLSPKLGPIADWGLSINKNAIEVNTTDYSTNVPGIYAIGDINTYPGKLKLILCGFHEGALMAQSAFKHIYPDKHLSFKYTTVNGIESF